MPGPAAGRIPRYPDKRPAAVTCFSPGSIMTTAPETDPAPRTAYELAAAAADGDEAETARIWDSLDAPARARVLAALGAQARNTAYTAGKPGGTTTDLLTEQALDLLADLTDCSARTAALDALAGRARSVPLPLCDGCPRPAVALARARLRVLQALGFPPRHIAEISRRAARR